MGLDQIKFRFQQNSDGCFDLLESLVGRNGEYDDTVNGDVLYRLAVRYGFNDLTLLDTIRNDLKGGAEIGCKGKFRNLSKATNAPSAYENGAQVTNAICNWLSKGFACKWACKFR